MRILSSFGIALLMILFISCEQDPVSDELNTADASAKASVAAQKSDESIAAIVVQFASAEEDAQFTLLLAALNYAGITSLFAESDQYTVFAPTDAAFERFLGDNSLTDFTPEQVAAILIMLLKGGVSAIVWCQRINQEKLKLCLVLQSMSTALLELILTIAIWIQTLQFL